MAFDPLPWEGVSFFECGTHKDTDKPFGFSLKPAQKNGEHQLQITTTSHFRPLPPGTSRATARPSPRWRRAGRSVLAAGKPLEGFGSHQGEAIFFFFFFLRGASGGTPQRKRGGAKRFFGDAPKAEVFFFAGWFRWTPKGKDYLFWKKGTTLTQCSKRRDCFLFGAGDSPPARFHAAHC